MCWPVLSKPPTTGAAASLTRDLVPGDKRSMTLKIIPVHNEHDRGVLKEILQDLRRP